MTGPDLLRARARPQDTLLRHEVGREDEYLRLYEQQLVCVARGCDPTEAEVILARVSASRLWMLGRESADANALQRFMVSTSYFEGRRNLHLELNDRGLVQKKVLKQVEAIYEMADGLRARQVGEPIQRGVPKLEVMKG